jgi:WD40 repeat protein
MLKRVFLGVLFLASLAWVVYAGFDIASNKYNYSPEFLFGGEDEEVLIVIRPDEVSFSNIQNFDKSPCYELMLQLNDSIYNTGFFSLKREHMLLVKSDNWSQEDITALFQLMQPTELEKNSFKIGNYTGRYHKSKLYISSKNLEANKNESEQFKFDKKASAAIIRLNTNSTIKNYSDIYFTPEGRINYITKDVSIEQGNKVNDEQLFAGIISRNFKSYHFYERDYYATLDKDFENGPMSKWLLNGFIELEYNGETVIVSDFISGQDPILILNDLNQTIDSSRFNQQLTESFPSKGNSYTVKYIEDAVVICEKAEVCDQILSDYKLGNTIALSKDTRFMLYQNLPQLVSERFLSKEQSYSRSVYQGKLMETHTGMQVETIADIPEQSTISMSCGFDIKDFAVLPGNGNVIALGKDGAIKAFKDSKIKWEAKVQGEVLGEIQLIDLHGSGEQFVLLNTDREIHLWNITGHYETGFPIQMDTDAVNEVKFYRWKGKSYFLVANEDKKVVRFDSKGRELNMISPGISVTNKINVWASQKRLFAGFSNASHFKMYDMDKRRIHREFDILDGAHPLKIPNELLHYGIKENKLAKIDQKGIVFEFQNYNSAKILDILVDRGNPIILLQVMNEIHLVNIDGHTFGQIRVPFNEIEDVHIHTNDSGKTSIGVIDGLENNVYLYTKDGQRTVNKSLEGQSKIRISYSANQHRITTIVDQFVIQYFED